jgi:hypothetical protein
MIRLWDAPLRPEIASMPRSLALTGWCDVIVRGSRNFAELICGQTNFVEDAHGSDSKRFMVRADELLTAFIGLERATRGL